MRPKPIAATLKTRKKRTKTRGEPVRRSYTRAAATVAGLLAAGFSVFYIHKHIEDIGKNMEIMAKKLNLNLRKDIIAIQQELAKVKNSYLNQTITKGKYLSKLVELLNLYYSKMNPFIQTTKSALMSKVSGMFK